MVSFTVEHLELHDNSVNSHKFYRFYRYTHSDGSVTVMRQWGRVGTTGQSSREPYDNVAAADKAIDKVRRDKWGKGYEILDKRSVSIAPRNDTLQDFMDAYDHDVRKSGGVDYDPKWVPTLIIDEERELVDLLRVGRRKRVLT